MADDDVPADVRVFIAQYIDSIAQLEALLLLRNESQGTWDAARAAKRLYVSEREAGDLLTRLGDDGLISRVDDAFKYAPPDGELAALVDRLAEVYSRQLIPITNLIHSKPGRIRQFADAFKFKKDR